MILLNELAKNRLSSNPPKISIFLWFLWFCLCLVPLDIAGYSINYLFVLTPVWAFLSGNKINTFVPSVLGLYIFLSSLIFLVALLYQVGFYVFADRRLISFFIFMSQFSFLWFRFNINMLNAFFAAILSVGVLLSMHMLIKFLESDTGDISQLKTIVGNQRYAFIYFFSISSWFWFSKKYPNFSFRNVIQPFVIGVITLGIVLTFSRAAYVAFITGTLCSIFLINNPKPLKWLVLSVIPSLGVLLFVFKSLPELVDFINVQIITFVSEGVMTKHLEASETSEGARLAIWKHLATFVFSNPLTGSGFLGSWVLAEWSGSAHSEYFDRFLRLGVIGFSIYCYIIIKLLIFLKNNNSSLLIGFISTLIFGLFHETFSLSHGAVILSLLLNLYTFELKKQKSEE